MLIKSLKSRCANYKIEIKIIFKLLSIKMFLKLLKKRLMQNLNGNSVELIPYYLSG
jgi:hypothetical protein